MLEAEEEDEIAGDEELPPPPKKPKRRSLPESVREVIEARQILANLVRRDFSTQHRNSFLGLAWSLLNPMLTVAVFTLVFRIFRAAPTGTLKVPFALFFFCGLILWNLFSSSVVSGSTSIVGGGYLIQKVYFPREILPMSAVISAAITFAFEFVVLIVVMLLFGVIPDWHMVLIPIPILIAILLAYGFSLVLSTANVYFRDVEHFLSFGMLLWFWISGVIFDSSLVRERGETAFLIFNLNPIVPVLDAFRRILLGHQMPNWTTLGYSAAWAVFLCFGGMWLFNRHERKFAELI